MNNRKKKEKSLVILLFNDIYRSHSFLFVQHFVVVGQLAKDVVAAAAATRKSHKLAKVK
jgi:hypothetical protein